MSMTTKATACAASALAAARMGPWSTPPWTLEERLQRIEAIGQRISGYIQFICQAGSLTGTSAEAKERAVKAFYERMVVMDSQLGQIQEILRLE